MRDFKARAAEQSLFGNVAPEPVYSVAFERRDGRVPRKIMFHFPLHVSTDLQYYRPGIETLAEWIADQLMVVAKAARGKALDKVRAEVDRERISRLVQRSERKPLPGRTPSGANKWLSSPRPLPRGKPELYKVKVTVWLLAADWKMLEDMFSVRHSAPRAGEFNHFLTDLIVDRWDRLRSQSERKIFSDEISTSGRNYSFKGGDDRSDFDRELDPTSLVGKVRDAEIGDPEIGEGE